MSVRIIVDSTADMPKDIESRLTVVPLTISFGDEEFIDRLTIDCKTFYEKLESCETLPHTSQATPFAFEEKFREAVDAGDTVVALTVASKLSGTYQSATVAAAEFPDRVYVVDSKTVAIGLSILAERALSFVDEGFDAKTIADKLTAERENVNVIALLDTLEYLKRGGRISPAVAFAGGLLGIKPLVNIKDGEINVLGKARGAKLGNSMLNKEIELAGGICPNKPFLLGYTGVSDELLSNYVSASDDVLLPLDAPIRRTSIGSVVGTHAGPGAFAVAFFSR